MTTARRPVSMPALSLAFGLLLGAGAALGAVGPADAAAAVETSAPACPASPYPPEVVVTRLDGGVAYDLTKTSEEIGKFTTCLNAFAVARGLTATEFRRAHTVSMQAAPVPGGWCLRPVRIEATIGFDPMTVYIESRYPRGSCEFETVLRHELEHVRANRESLDAHLPQVRSALETALRSPAFPMVASDREAGKAAVMQVIARVMDEAVAPMVTERTARHARLDSPESYKASQDACSGW